MKTVMVEKIYRMGNTIATQCDGAVTEDNVGFNKFDSPRAKALIYEGDNDEYGARLLALILIKYKRQLLKVYSESEVDELVQLVKSIRARGRTVTIEDNKIILRFNYSKKIVDFVKSTFGKRWWNKRKTQWEVDITEYQKVSQLLDYDFNIPDDFETVAEKLAGDKVKIINKVEGRGATEDEIRQITRTYATVDDGIIYIYYPYDEVLSEHLWNRFGARWDGEAKARYITTTDNIKSLYDFLRKREEYVNKWNFKFTDTFYIELEKAEEAISSSRAKDADIEIPAPNGFHYLPFQKAGISFIDNHNGRALIGDEMGLGKTIEAIGWLNLKGVKSDAYPVLVVCPATMKWKWAEELDKWLIDAPDIEIVTSKTVKFNKGSGVIIINYDILKTFKDQLMKKGFNTVMMDESHYIKNHKAKRTKLALAIGEGAKYRMAITGTPFLAKPIEGWTVLNWVNPDTFNSFWGYVTGYCNAHEEQVSRDRVVWNMNGASNTLQLQNLLRGTTMIRRLKKDVLEELPAKRRVVIPVKNNGNGAQDLKWLKGMIADGRTDSGDKPWGNSGQAILAEIEQLKQEAAMAKLPMAIDFIKNTIGEKKLVVFAHHKKIIKALMKEFGDQAVKIDGSTKDRQTPVEQFQNDDDIRLFVGSIRAAGLGITLTAASDVLFLEFDWTPANHSQAEDRTHRIGQKDSVTSYYLSLVDSIDEHITKILTKKQNIIDALLDGDVEPTEAAQNSIFGELLTSLEGAMIVAKGGE